MSQKKLARLRPRKKNRTRETLALSPEAKAKLQELVESWEVVRERLQQIAKKQAKNGDYSTASENFLLSEGMNFCVHDLRQMLPD